MFFNSLKKIFDGDNEDNRYYQAQYQTKLREIETSFDSLKHATSDVIKQAVDTTDSLKRNIELYEKRFDVLINNSDDMVIIKTINQQWAVINPFACKVLGIDSAKCIGKSNKQLAQQYPQLSQILSILDKAEQQSWITKTQKKTNIRVNANGQTLEFEILIKPIETSDHQVCEIVMIGRPTNIV